MIISAKQTRGGGKAYVARIGGTDAQHGLAREFLGLQASVSEAGLFEVCSAFADKRTFEYFVALPVGGALQMLRVPNRDLAVELATAMDHGQTVGALEPRLNDYGQMSVATRAVDGSYGLNWK